MYTYFKIDYEKFHDMTLYPKMWHGVAVSNSNPWSILHYKKISNSKLEEFLNFYIEDLKDFFTKNIFEEASWDNIKAAMLNDKDISWSESWEIFNNTLKKY